MLALGLAAVFVGLFLAAVAGWMLCAESSGWRDESVVSYPLVGPIPDEERDDHGHAWFVEGCFRCDLSRAEEW